MTQTANFGLSELVKSLDELSTDADAITESGAKIPAEMLSTITLLRCTAELVHAIGKASDSIVSAMDTLTEALPNAGRGV
jgi:hypothetical protein